tara:strand:- start:6892 stop:7455 length:564 start_codon:yes stop_codon:yes gene_type:complete
MINNLNDAFLEFFDLNEKNILCCSTEESHLNGLLKRGANVWVFEKYFKKANRINNLIDNKKIYFISEKTNKNFEFLLINIEDLEKIKEISSLHFKYKIILASKKNLVRNFFKFKKYEKNDFDIYFIIPSLKRIKFIVPERSNESLERYWSFSDSNPLLIIFLILEWIFIKNIFLRKFFSDKLIIIKC